MMKLTFKEPYLSITGLEEVELPRLTILTGENGAGKTHLLRSILNGSCSFGGVDRSKVMYFDYSTFIVSNAAGMTASQIEQIINQQFQEYQSNFRVNFETVYKKYIGIGQVADDRSSIQDISNLGGNVWNYAEDGPLREIASKYKEEILAILDTPSVPGRYGQSGASAGSRSAISRCLVKSGKLAHELDLQDFKDYSSPIGGSSELFGASLGALFSKYKIDEFNWCHDQFEKGESKSINISRGVFRRKYVRPWKLVNDLLDRMGQFCLSDQTFKFKITDPEKIELRLSDYSGFSFSPTLINKNTGAACDFSSLSSGEKTLLALAISVFSANDGYKVPKVLLLDEIDASLHPSMVKAMLYAIEGAFLASGVAVILATHSPTTVSLAPERSTFLLSGSGGTKVIKAVEKAKAVEILTEGLATLDDGLRLVSGLKDRLNLITEGNNITILEKYFKLAGIKGVNFVRGLEDRSGKEQLKSYYDLCCVVDDKKVLFVWDCDGQNIVNKLQETANVFKYAFPLQSDSLAKSGIENMFNSEILREFELITESKVGRQVSFDKRLKTDFAQSICATGKLSDFANFQSLKEKIENIQSA